MLHGSLHFYGKEKRLKYFETRNEQGCYISETSKRFFTTSNLDHESSLSIRKYRGCHGPVSRRCLISIPGLNDTPMALNSSYFLNYQALREEAVLVEPLFTSSNKGFGFTNIDQDAEELGAFLDHLSDAGRDRLILYGHSTGCATILHYLRSRHAKWEHKIKAIFLHAPISIRDYLYSTLLEADRLLKWAEGQCDAGNPESIYNGLLLGSVFTAGRLKSILTKDSKEDYLSLNMSEEDRKRRFRGIKVPTFVIFQKDDEFVPDKSVYEKLGESFTNASKHVTIMPFSDGGHAPKKLSYPTVEKFAQALGICFDSNYEPPRREVREPDTPSESEDDDGGNGCGREMDMERQSDDYDGEEDRCHFGVDEPHMAFDDEASENDPDKIGGFSERDFDDFNQQSMDDCDSSDDS